MRTLIGIVIMIVLSILASFVDHTLLNKNINWTSSIYIMLGMLYVNIVQTYIF